MKTGKNAMEKKVGKVIKGKKIGTDKNTKKDKKITMELKGGKVMTKMVKVRRAPTLERIKILVKKNRTKMKIRMEQIE